ncbi:hypothetical protein Poli38472_005698 [Pythium oligandrum]|uniref:DUF218 domain-containing protein n=1 Tax=Pythium oligandrum TaxID=41045 RepID=A0A8K1CI03_PYTOL|nr:hypothetical protein Poli38472_005698 [Pythium oligandrum]|eukprot:TMW63080.1 hypothetical protein Poli38472_005698 [Pythium oligandrum]
MSTASGSTTASSTSSRPKMVGTLLPQDSLRGLRDHRSKALAAMVPAPLILLPRSSSSSSSTTPPNPKLLAAAGLDLFRKGLAFDGLQPTHQEARHPAVKPNLLSIPEDDAMQTDPGTDCQLIVVIGGPLNSRGEPGIWVSNRIAMTIQLYWQITLSFDEDSAAPSTTCYVVPTASESSDEGIGETEAIRNALVGTGISPHHIIMDCTSTNVIDNAVQLVPILLQRHIKTIHIVTSEFHVPRVRLCYDTVLAAISDLSSLDIVYHSAPDGLTATARAERAATEQALMDKAQAELERTVQRLATDQHYTAARRSFVMREAHKQKQRPSTYNSGV